MTKFLNISTDTNLGGSSASDEVVSSQKALKTYIDAHSGGGGGSSFYPNLLDFKWSDHELNDQSWLNANTFSWQDGTVYSDAYNHLTADYSGGTSQTETIGSHTITFVEATDGHRITTDESTVADIYTESGVAWFYVLDTANQRFKLPRINPTREELIQIVRAKGDGISIGFTDGTNLGGSQSESSGAGLMITRGSYGKQVGTSSGSGDLTHSKVIGFTTDSTKSGIISDMTESTSVFKGNLYLYFYVGQFSQSATEQTAGLNASLFNGKVDLDGSNATFPHITQTYINGTDWYRIWSDGWCEQGGTNTYDGNHLVTLLVPFKDTNYFVLATGSSRDNSNPNYSSAVGTRTTTQFNLSFSNNTTGNSYNTWRAYGYIS